MLLHGCGGEYREIDKGNARQNEGEVGRGRDYYYRARYYNAEVGRFISEDPIGFAGRDVNFYTYADSVGKHSSMETNFYSYAFNNPVNFMDLLGLSADEPGIGNPTNDNWPPPFPGDLCEMGCYLTFFNDYYWCNVGWSYGCMNDPLQCENGRQGSSACKRSAHERYKGCIEKKCQKKKCP
jgi:RHS repeat-associated protein